MKEILEHEEGKRSHLNPKSYRISVTFDLIFEALSNIYGSDKTDLFISLFQADSDLDLSQINTLLAYTKTELIELMIDKLAATNSSYKELEHFFNHPKLRKVDKLISESTLDIKKAHLRSFRIMPNYQEFVKSFSSKKISSVVELAIAYTLVHTSDFEFRLVEVVLKRIIKQREKKQK